jgi:hypothetical protein
MRCTAWVLCLVGGAGCQAFDASLLRQDASVDAGPTPVDAGLDGGEIDSGPSCSLRRPPTRPMGVDGAETDDRTFALRDVLLVQGDGWREIGWDRDALCSDGTPGGTYECVPPNRGAPPEPDGTGGIDNAFGNGFAMVLAVLLSEDLQMSLRAEAELGHRTPLVRMRGWNGTDEDPVVSVTIAGAAAVAANAGGGPCAPAPPMMGDPPEWGGNDCAWANSGEFTGGREDTPMLSDEGAWVSGRTLVAAIRDRGGVIMPGGALSMDVRLTDAVLTAEIAPDGTSLENVTLAGRWSRTDMLMSLDGLGICSGTSSYMLFSGRLDDRLDIRAMPGSGGEDVSCDALSFAVQYRGTAVRWAGLALAGPLPEPCAAGM